jgi:hypothetical protein
MTEQPEPFTVVLQGPSGRYELRFLQNHDEGEFQVDLGGGGAVWPVEVCEHDGEGWRLAGLTRGTAAHWGDTFWFEVRTSLAQAEYFTDRLVRIDRAPGA